MIDEMVKQYLISGGKITACPPCGMSDRATSLVDGMLANIDGEAKEAAFLERKGQVQARRAAQKRFEREEYP